MTGEFLLLAKRPRGWVAPLPSPELGGASWVFPEEEPLVLKLPVSTVVVIVVVPVDEFPRPPELSEEVFTAVTVVETLVFTEVVGGSNREGELTRGVVDVETLIPLLGTLRMGREESPELVFADPPDPPKEKPVVELDRATEPEEEFIEAEIGAAFSLAGFTAGVGDSVESVKELGGFVREGSSLLSNFATICASVRKVGG